MVGNYTMAGVCLLAVVAAGSSTIVFLQRSRFRQLRRRGGFVEVDEREIRYFSNEGCAIMSLHHLDSVEVVGDVGSDQTWVLHRRGTGLGPVVIPHGAHGTDKLFDAFAALPGIDLTRLIKGSQHSAKERYPVWRKPGDCALDTRGGKRI